MQLKCITLGFISGSMLSHHIAVCRNGIKSIFLHFTFFHVALVNMHLFKRCILTNATTCVKLILEEPKPPHPHRLGIH